MIPETEISSPERMMPKKEAQNNLPFDEHYLLEGNVHSVSQGVIPFKVSESRDDNLRSSTANTDITFVTEQRHPGNGDNDLRVSEPSNFEKDNGIPCPEVNFLGAGENVEGSYLEPQPYHTLENFDQGGELTNFFLIPSGGPKEYKREEIYNDLAELFMTAVEDSEPKKFDENIAPLFENVNSNDCSLGDIANAFSSTSKTTTPEEWEDKQGNEINTLNPAHYVTQTDEEELPSTLQNDATQCSDDENHDSSETKREIRESSHEAMMDSKSPVDKHDDTGDEKSTERHNSSDQQIDCFDGPHPPGVVSFIEEEDSMEDLTASEISVVLDEQAGEKSIPFDQEICGHYSTLYEQDIPMSTQVDERPIDEENPFDENVGPLGNVKEQGRKPPIQCENVEEIEPLLSLAFDEVPTGRNKVFTKCSTNDTLKEGKQDEILTDEERTCKLQKAHEMPALVLDHASNEHGHYPCSCSVEPNENLESDAQNDTLTDEESLCDVQNMYHMPKSALVSNNDVVKGHENSLCRRSLELEENLNSDEQSDTLTDEESLCEVRHAYQVRKAALATIDLSKGQENYPCRSSEEFGENLKWDAQSDTLTDEESLCEVQNAYQMPTSALAVNSLSNEQKSCSDSQSVEFEENLKSEEPNDKLTDEESLCEVRNARQMPNLAFLSKGSAKEHENYPCKPREGSEEHSQSNEQSDILTDEESLCEVRNARQMPNSALLSKGSAKEHENYPCKRSEESEEHSQSNEQNGILTDEESLCKVRNARQMPNSALLSKGSAKEHENYPCKPSEESEEHFQSNEQSDILIEEESLCEVSNDHQMPKSALVINTVSKEQENCSCEQVAESEGNLKSDVQNESLSNDDIISEACSPNATPKEASNNFVENGVRNRVSDEDKKTLVTNNGDEGSSMQNTNQLEPQETEVTLHMDNDSVNLKMTNDSFDAYLPSNDKYTNANEDNDNAKTPETNVEPKFLNDGKDASSKGSSDLLLEIVEENETVNDNVSVLTEEMFSVRELTKEFKTKEETPQSRSKNVKAKASIPHDFMSKVVCVQSQPQSTAPGVASAPLDNSKSTILHEISIREECKPKKGSFMGIKRETKEKFQADLFSEIGKISELPNAAMDAMKAGAKEDIFSNVGLVADMRPQNKSNPLKIQPAPFNVSRRLAPMTTVLQKVDRNRSIISLVPMMKSLNKIVTKVGTQVMESTVVDETVGLVEDIVWALGEEDLSCGGSDSDSYYSESTDWRSELRSVEQGLASYCSKKKKSKSDHYSRSRSKARSRAASSYAPSYNEPSVYSHAESSYGATNSRTEALLMEKQALEKAILDLRSEKELLEKRALENRVKGLRDEKKRLERSVAESQSFHSQTATDDASLHSHAASSYFSPKVRHRAPYDTQASLKSHDASSYANSRVGPRSGYEGIPQNYSNYSRSVQSDHDLVPYDKYMERSEHNLVPYDNSNAKGEEKEREELQKSSKPDLFLNPMLKMVEDSMRSISEDIQVKLSRVHELVEAMLEKIVGEDEEKTEDTLRGQKAIVLHETPSVDYGCARAIIPFEFEHERTNDERALVLHNVEVDNEGAMVLHEDQETSSSPRTVRDARVADPNWKAKASIRKSLDDAAHFMGTVTRDSYCT